MVPVAISNSQAILERQYPRIKSAHVVLEFCEPIDLDSLTRPEKKELGKRVRSIIEEKLKSHKEILEKKGDDR